MKKYDTIIRVINQKTNQCSINIENYWCIKETQKNICFKARQNDRLYFLKINKEYDMMRTILTEMTYNALVDKIFCPKKLFSGSIFLENKEMGFWIYEWIEGRKYADLSIHNCMDHYIKNVLNIVMYFNTLLPEEIFSIDFLKEYKKIYLKSDKKLKEEFLHLKKIFTTKQYDAITDIQKEYSKIEMEMEEFNEQQDLVIIHGDLNRGNIIEFDNKMFLVDLDSCRLGFMMEELSYIFLDCCVIKDFLSRYFSYVHFLFGNEKNIDKKIYYLAMKQLLEMLNYIEIKKYERSEIAYKYYIARIQKFKEWRN